MAENGTVNAVFILGRFTKKVTFKTKKLYFACSIAVQCILFNFGLKKLFNERLAFPPLHRDFYKLLIANFKDHLVQRIIFVLLIN